MSTIAKEDTTSGTRITFYIDGTVRGKPIDHGVRIRDSNGPLRIGMEGVPLHDGFFAGKIDEVRIYNLALTPEQVLAVMGAR